MPEKEKNMPILTIQQAKRYFILMGCSHFHLSREDFQRADEYYALKISPDLESQWRKESFEDTLSKISSDSPKNCGMLYSTLKDLIEQNDFYLEKMAELTDKIIHFLPVDQIHYVLSAIIGNNGSNARGGLIQGSFELKRLDLTSKFVSHAKAFLEKAEKENVSLLFVRGYFVDVIEYFNLKEDKAYLSKLREKDNMEALKYYKEGAKEGNQFSMQILAEFYSKGIGSNREQITYHHELQRQIKFVCSTAIQALFDTHMLMFPEAYQHKNKNTLVYLYTFYAIRQRAVLSVRKLIEPSGKSSDKITIHSIVKLATSPDFLLLTEKEKTALSADFDTLFNSEHTKRVKDFRDAFCHSIINKDDVVCYYKDFMYIVEGSIYILEQLYLIAFSINPTFFKEAQNITMLLAQEYWQSISNAAGAADNRNDLNTRLDQLLSGKF